MSSAILPLELLRTRDLRARISTQFPQRLELQTGCPTRSSLDRPSFTPNGKDQSRVAKKFLLAIRTKEPAFFTTVVQNLLRVTDAGGGDPLCVSCSKAAPLPLRRLSIEYKHFLRILAVSESEPRTRPFFPDLTHLELILWYDSYDRNWSEFMRQLVRDLSKLPQLTHMAFPFSVEEGMRTADIDLILSGLPNLTAIILLSDRQDCYLSSEGSDWRRVVEIIEDNPWELHHSENDHLWARVERIIAARQAGLTVEKDKEEEEEDEDSESE
ncbi:hypothetical protein FB45DRAFT_1021751 [Roridomyces roridus]|uniref:Uncharacterized protein n=1 Tax=Roridomyces roridus TaxID=1738132 RepID=A0AAD7B168_9AGAR|nr:hypothetical protein FB45DRAFT_1040773 [Roridomyces roridus]KAJ7640966.1 hypothetical protein FB45DRAFT_1021751 [Roridomyces roridus]